MDFRSLFNREGTPEQLASKEEQVDQIRHTILHMAEFGVVASDKAIPENHKPEAVKLPYLLRYSSNSRRHLQNLVGILNLPREFQIVEQPSHAIEGTVVDEGNIYHVVDNNRDRFIFPHDETVESLYAFSHQLHVLGQTTTGVSIETASDGIWRVQYDYYIPAIGASDDDERTARVLERAKQYVGRHAPLFRPEAVHLVNFTFSPTSLSADWFANNTFPSETRQFIKSRGKSTHKPFESMRFSLDAQFALQKLSKYAEHKTPPGVTSIPIAGLQKEGNKEFSIVNVGKATIGTVDYHIYTGAEHPLIEERIPDTVPQRNLVPAFGLNSQRL